METGSWRKSTRSQGVNNCVEVVNTLDELRDSKNPNVTLSVTRHAFDTLVRTLSR